MLAESSVKLGPPTNHVFVDGENVHQIDPEILPGKPLCLTILLGMQSKPDWEGLEKLMPRAMSVQVVRLTSSGKNVLDFTLSYYVGQTVLKDSAAIIHIVSKDQGFDPLIEHLCERRINAQRHENYSSLTLHAPVKVIAGPESPLRERVLEHLRKDPKNRPRTRKKLVTRLLHAGLGAPEAEIESVIDELGAKGKWKFGANDAVEYRL
jgi:hypothetical protein